MAFHYHSEMKFSYLRGLHSGGLQPSTSIPIGQYACEQVLSYLYQISKRKELLIAKNEINQVLCQLQHSMQLVHLYSVVKVKNMKTFRNLFITVADQRCLAKILKWETLDEMRIAVHPTNLLSLLIRTLKEVISVIRLELFKFKPQKGIAPIQPYPFRYHLEAAALMQAEIIIRSISWQLVKIINQQ